MPPKTCKALDLDALARAIKVALLLCAGALAGCQTSSHVSQQPQSTPAARAVDVQFNPAWSESHNDIWDRMRSGFQLQDEIDTNPRIERQRLWYMSNPSFIERASERGSPYLHFVVESLEERDMPLELALLPAIESAYNPLAISHAQAVGLWQFIPTTGTHFNLRQTSWYDGRRDIKASTNAALTYLSRLHDMFNGDWLLALAAYNAGEGTVSRAIERNERLGLPTDYWNLRLPQETQDYVPKLLALSQLVMEPEAYGIRLSPIANEPYFASVRVKPGLDLSRVAAIADLDEDELYLLNPAFKRRITMDGPQQLLVPLDKAETVKASLATLKPREVATYQNYRVRRGDSLHSIAKRYHLSVAELKSANRLSGNRVRQGQSLVIPGQPGRPLIEPQSPRQLAQVEQRPAAKRTTYKVRSGESLWQIARNTGVGVDDLKRLNGLKGSTVKAGQVLKLGGGQQLASAGKSARENATYYKVKRGDSMYLIAKRFNVEMKHLKRWNPRSSRALKPGQTLTLYLDTASR
ncbi:Membrane-bound lytic murein transglycosylase D [compost metagenome]|uniref:Membrane-bound lytic murein transglycosylase D n=1 Tax=Pseudomonas jinjuensis TaxID=198616 RepID=A0A1G9YYG7_9PSED|nr:LysM peptidoglycan-binding domain-containing protein [Pseudomonas jinjuensis]SDN13591.1 membrane-bound lytic murein transglycosylase D [Pseudomonas jinjuensis]